jgi:hypothetical protein
MRAGLGEGGLSVGCGSVEHIIEVVQQGSSVAGSFVAGSFVAGSFVAGSFVAGSSVAGSSVAVDFGSSLVSRRVEPGDVRSRPAADRCGTRSGGARVSCRRLRVSVSRYVIRRASSARSLRIGDPKGRLPPAPASAVVGACLAREQSQVPSWP